MGRGPVGKVGHFWMGHMGRCVLTHNFQLKNVQLFLAPLKLRPYGAIQMCILLLLLLFLLFDEPNTSHWNIHGSLQQILTENKGAEL